MTKHPTLAELRRAAMHAIRTGKNLEAVQAYNQRADNVNVEKNPYRKPPKVEYELVSTPVDKPVENEGTTGGTTSGDWVEQLVEEMGITEPTDENEETVNDK